MVSIFVDPNELKTFELSLRELRGEIQSHRFSLERETADVQNFWNDEKYRKFRREQEDLMLQVQVFEKLCDRYCEYLLRKAAAAEMYLNR